MLYYIPIEPYETRYTADWIKQFETEFDNYDVEYTTILGKSDSTKVTDGGVLDACGTHLYKFSQLNQIIELIDNGKLVSGDVLFFADLWFPGLESLFYIRNMLKINFKICGVFHAGTYDEADFTYRTGMRPWGRYLEASWFTEIDKIFVATQFHKDMLLSKSFIVNGLADKICVTGLPFYNQELRRKYYSKNKENLLVFPHRLDAEKHPELFLELVDWLRDKNVEFTPVRTIVETNSRDEYFKLLGKSKVMVSFADQETFGYSTLESMSLGNIVIVPNKLSYVETVPRDFRYDTKEQCFNMVLKALQDYVEPTYKNIDEWRYSICHMIEEMGVYYAF